MLNITAHGNLGRDPELKTTPNGNQVCSFSLAVSTNRDETTWINCQVWGKRAQTAAEYLKKGSKITVAGRGKLRTSEKKDGTQGQSLEMDVNDFTLPLRESNQSAGMNNSEMPF